ncbi:YbhN family protein [Streptomyces sp. NPDC058286]|uniref:lysylphosphatidylglycerol synthase transmembrane domain-containing protein n=1 Tax=Streptomyces sp. NPDC058286 TaxID=3346422 RepID=UPI0036E5B170
MTSTLDSSLSRPERRRGHPWLRRCLIAAVLGLITVELALGRPALTSALTQLRAPHLGWLLAALAAALAAMGAYARMQRRLLLSAGLYVPLHRELALTYAAHSLNETLPGGPLFSTQLNYQQMRRFGATPAVASWCIALSGILSTSALAVITALGALADHGTPSWLTLVGLTTAVLLTTVGIRWITRHPETLLPLVRTSLAPINRLRRKSTDHGLERIQAFLDQLKAARLTPGHAAAAATYALLNWLLDAGCLWLCLHSVTDQAITSTQLLLAFCAGMAAGTLTIVPGGLGIIHNALILGLISGGLDTPTAIAAVVLYRLINLGFVIGAGWITWGLVLRQTRREQPQRISTG